jgi:hypothetical protein
MTKQSAIKQLETTLSKLQKLNFNLEGNALGEAISQVAHVRDGLQSGREFVRKAATKRNF